MLFSKLAPNLHGEGGPAAAEAQAASAAVVAAYAGMPAPRYPKSEERKARIRQCLVQNAQGNGPLKDLISIVDLQTEEMIDVMIEVTCKAGDLVTKHGENGEHMYLVDSGKFGVYDAEGEGTDFRRLRRRARPS